MIADSTICIDHLSAYIRKPQLILHMLQMLLYWLLPLEMLGKLPVLKYRMTLFLYKFLLKVDLSWKLDSSDSSLHSHYKNFFTTTTQSAP